MDAGFQLLTLSAGLLALDVAIEPVSRVTGINALFFFLPILAVETLILWLLRWGTLGRAALAAFVMNTITTLLGAVLTLNYPDGFLLALILSVVIEAFVLMLLSRHSKVRSWLSAIAANVVSYTLLFIFIFLVGTRL
jgi:hypothetical protein